MRSSESAALSAIEPLSVCPLRAGFLHGDVHDGLAPSSAFSFGSRSWSPAEIGMVMTIGGLTGIIATTPAGALIDKTTAKRDTHPDHRGMISRRCFCILFTQSSCYGRGAGRERRCRGADRAGHRRRHARPLKQKGFAHRSVATRPSTTPAMSPRRCWPDGLVVSSAWARCSR